MPAAKISYACLLQFLRENGDAWQFRAVGRNAGARGPFTAESLVAALKALLPDADAFYIWRGVRPPNVQFRTRLSRASGAGVEDLRRFILREAPAREFLLVMLSEEDALEDRWITILRRAPADSGGPRSATPAGWPEFRRWRSKTSRGSARG